MRRRQFIAGLGSVAAWPVVARAQQGMPVIGWLDALPGLMDPYLPAFKQGLADTGYVLGRNVAIESREGGIDRLPVLATDLVWRQVTVIVALGVRPAQAAKAATQTIPVVFVMIGDPVEVGLVASLNRPSGNLTGVTSVGYEVVGKRLELLHKLMPAADPIAYLLRTPAQLDQGTRPEDLEEMRAEADVRSAARVLGVRALPLRARTESEVAAAFATIVEQRAGALLTGGAFESAAYNQIISLAGRYAVPTLFASRDPVVNGGLASYGPSTSELLRQVGIY